MRETTAHLLEQTPRPSGSSARNPVYASCAPQTAALGKKFLYKLRDTVSGASRWYLGEQHGLCWCHGVI